MVWGATSDRAEQRRRGSALTAAYEGPRGIPHVTNEQAGLGQTGRRADRDGRAGSRGGAPIWVCAEAWMPEDGLSRSYAEKRAGLQRGADESERNDADPDGFAVFGRYPKGFLRHALKVGLLGDVDRQDVLHVCSGTLSETERWTVDLRPQARPRVIADGRSLPFRDASFPAVMLDPPYSDQYARNLYGVENPRPSWLLKEAARVVQPGGRIGMLHVAVPFAPPGCRLVKVYGVSTGVGFRVRGFTVYERQQAGLL
jgi:hypothetical protein